MVVASWYTSLEFAPLLFGREDLDESRQLLVSVVFGACVLVVAYLLDRPSRKDYAFWLYLMGLAAFWGGLTLMDSVGPWSRLGYFVVNLVLIAISSLLDRRAFAVFGCLCNIFRAMAFSKFLSAFRLFKGSLFLPLALTVIGAGVIVGAVAYQRNRARMDACIVGALPDGLRGLLPANRE